MAHQLINSSSSINQSYFDFIQTSSATEQNCLLPVSMGVLAQDMSEEQGCGSVVIIQGGSDISGTLSKLHCHVKKLLF
jgi:hypothetical protein